MKCRSALALLALVAAPVAAQHPGMRGHDPQMMGHMMQMQQMMGPMMQAMAFEPAHLLARKDSLHLTPQQITRLTAIRDAAQQAHDAAATEAKTHMDAIAQAFKAANPDTTSLKAHFQPAHTAMGNAHWVMLSAAAQAKAVLTDEQRARVDGWVNTMMERRTGRD